MKKATAGLALLVGLSMMAAINGASAQEKQIHRVVTTIDQDNKSGALFDSMVPLKIGGAGRAWLPYG
jgi:hypothetical protein